MRILEVADDGCGLDAPVDEYQTLGLSLVRTLARQLHGELHVDTNGGTRVQVVYPAGSEEAAA